ncbi:hypothetical protein WMY93_017720 [Mugilogobius chulae]|uniref:TNFR-Cys domain-containing protein n=1 Tax=Mugilogobius chulae TaxID=88201 RepID=A0AAW0NQ70_9GOBI
MTLHQVKLLLLCTFAVWAAADPLCDPDKQYLLNGECCEMCKPGTSMTSPENCRNPVCKDCEDGEYTNKYNREKMCKRQPYCDHNLNFVFRESSSKTEVHICQCEKGFHCSSGSCTMCVPHTECEPGQGAKTIGGQNQDTVCEECPAGTFSDEKSWNGTCKKMKECPAGQEPQGGSSVSDNDCGPAGMNRSHIIASVLVPLAFVAVVAVVYLSCRYRRKSGHELLNKMGEIEANGFPKEENRKKEPYVTNPTEDNEFESSSPAQETTLPDFTSISVESEFGRPPAQETTPPGCRSIPRSQSTVPPGHDRERTTTVPGPQRTCHVNARNTATTSTGRVRIGLYCCHLCCKL